MSIRDGWKRLLYLVGCSLDCTSIEDFCKTHKAMSPDVVLKLGRIPVEGMIVKCNVLLALSARIALKTGVYRNHDLSIDFHDVAYNGRKNMYTVNVLKGDKMKRCLRYGVCGLTGRGSFLALAIQPYEQGATNAIMVEKLLERLPCSPGLVLMDRYFCSVDVYNVIEARGMNFLTPYKLNSRTDELYKESVLDGVMVKDYLMKSGTGGDRVVKMHFQYDPCNEYYAYVSNIEDVMVKVHYPYRWNIENCLAKNMVDAVTSSTSMAYRLLLETISLILANLWKLLVKTMPVYMTMKAFKRMLGHILVLEDETWENKEKERG
ncbi:transposase [Methanocella conradii]|uniref:transposase n=1 Tax=Methanocella conradii TaxID=1175444 RepID=UPI001305460C|nr:transposase [Methanocella conradii]